jgi:hypothetical protein
MINRHTTFFVKDIKPIEFCGKPVMWQMDLNGAFEKPFETQPTEGEHDFKTCEGCQKTLKELIKRLTEKFEGNHKDGAKPFPSCCTQHSELTKLKEFNKVDFVGVPEMVARKIIYTNSHIKNNHHSETYYKDITDYIDYTVESFGQMPSNAEPLYLSDYFFYITDLLERNTDIEKGRKNRLLEFLKAYSTPTETPKTDFNILLGTYQKWLKVFPFEISFFSTLKPHFEKQLPILNGKPETNKYTGLARAKMHTKGSLIDVLLNLTNNLLTQINTTTLYEKGLLTEPQKIKLELVLNERKMKLKQGYVNSSKDEEQRYRKILKEWFADEKRFIDEVTPLVKALPPQPIKTKADILNEQLSKYGFFELEKVKTLSEQSTVILIEKIAESGLPYAIAMFDYLQYIPYLEKKHFDSKYKLNREVSKWFDSDKEGRAVKGNISSLLKNTTENKDRYTAYKHKENVINDYEQLK